MLKPIKFIHGARGRRGSINRDLGRTFSTAGRSANVVAICAVSRCLLALKESLCSLPSIREGRQPPQACHVIDLSR